MAGQYGLGRFDVVPIAAGAGLAFRDASAITFVCTGNDTFTLTAASSFGGSYATPGNIITLKYTNTSTANTAAWVKATQSASNAVTISSGSVVFSVLSSQLSDPTNYVKVSVGASGLVMAIYDLDVLRTPPNMQIRSA
jgi:hypothetical protein